MNRFICRQTAVITKTNKNKIGVLHFKPSATYVVASELRGGKENYKLNQQDIVY
jgi:hypothetical protein